MNPEPRLPRAVSLAEIQSGSLEIRTALSAGDVTGRPSGVDDWSRAILSLRNIVRPLPLPKGAELISLTTYEGRLVVLTSKGPYIRRDSSWEKVLASQPDPELL